MRMRLRFTKSGKIRFTGHRDVARLFERAVRRAGIPVAYSEGFSPRMRLSFGLALPTCYESDSEYLDILVDPDRVDAERAELRLVGGCEGDIATLAEVAGALCGALPAGIDVVDSWLAPRSGPSLQELVTACGWEFSVPAQSFDEARAAVERVNAATEVVSTRTRKGEVVTEDIAGAIGSLAVSPAADGSAHYAATLAATPRVVRPSELMDALAPGHEIGVARRTHQWNDDEQGRRCDISQATAPHAPPVEVAS